MPTAERAALNCTKDLRRANTQCRANYRSNPLSAVRWRAARLRQDFELDSGGIALVLSLLDRIDDLERRLHDLQCQLPR